MRIVHLVAGAGAMYCGSCLHANRLAAALQSMGEDVLLAPLYTPIRTDEEDVSIDRVALGGINVYLQQQSVIFRRLPKVFDRWLSHPRLLRWVTRRGTGTRAESLGEMTVSILRGEDGRQRKELEELVAWLRRDVQPQLIHLSNVMLAGLARRIAATLDVPVVCTLSGEDIFLEKLPEPHYSAARAVLRERCIDLSALVAMNRYYADFMADYLAVPRERIDVIPPGLNLSAHPPEPPVRATRPSLTIGYLARVCPDKGLHHLAEAVALLADDPQLPALHLHVAGYMDEADRPYLREIESRMQRAGLADRFRYFGEVDHAGKVAFLQSLDVMCLPTVYRESKGLSVLEAWANAVPVVVPAHGVFPELIEETHGGLLCEPHDPADLARAIKRMIEDREFAAECGRRAHGVVHRHYGTDIMARRTIELYDRVCRKQ